MSNYNYDLNKPLEIDLTKKQEEQLLSEGFIYNSDDDSYDLYEEKFEDKEYVDFEYIEEDNVNSPVGQYEVFRKKNVYDVKYKVLTKEEWFVGFFKNILNKFVSKKETDISSERYDILEMQLTRWEISELQKIESVKMVAGIEYLTEKEEKKLRTEWIKYSFMKMTNKTKPETIKKSYNITKLEFKDYVKNYEAEYETIIMERYTEKVLKEKIIVERREVIQQIQYMYIPGVWSMFYNDENGTRADFKWEIHITTISGFNIFDEKFLNVEELKEELIDIIGEEHSMAEYIRAREDKKDGFNLEKETLI